MKTPWCGGEGLRGEEGRLCCTWPGRISTEIKAFFALSNVPEPSGHEPPIEEMMLLHQVLSRSEKHVLTATYPTGGETGMFFTLYQGNTKSTLLPST